MPLGRSKKPIVNLFVRLTSRQRQRNHIKLNERSTIREQLSPGETKTEVARYDTKSSYCKKRRWKSKTPLPKKTSSPIRKISDTWKPSKHRKKEEATKATKEIPPQPIETSTSDLGLTLSPSEYSDDFESCSNRIGCSDNSSQSKGDTGQCTRRSNGFRNTSSVTTRSLLSPYSLGYSSINSDSKHIADTSSKRSGRSQHFPLLYCDASTETISHNVIEGYGEVMKALHGEVCDLKLSQQECKKECLKAITSYEDKLVQEKEEFLRQLNIVQMNEKENSLENKQRTLLRVLKIEEQTRRQLLTMQEQRELLAKRQQEIYERERSIKSYSDQMDQIESYLDRRKEISDRKAEELRLLEEVLRLNNNEKDSSSTTPAIKTEHVKSGWTRAKDALLSEKIILEMALKRLSKEAERTRIESHMGKKKISDLNNVISDMDKSSKSKDKRIINLETRLDLMTFEQQKLLTNNNFFQ